jgi:hypothetical protein
MIEQEDGCFTFSDEDFERRYSSSEDKSSSAPGPHPTTQQSKPLVAQIVTRSRNRYMRTLRRRLLTSGSR